MVREAETLLDQVFAAPHDDAPRLIYADWLIQRGDPLGELIQIQCRLAAEPDDANRRGLRISENKLLKAHEATWLAPVLTLIDTTRMLEKPELTLKRGFIEAVQLSLAHAPLFPRLREKAPLLTSVRLLRDREEDMSYAPVPVIGELFRDPAFAQLTSLDLSLSAGGNPLARDIAASPMLRNLERLTIAASTWGEQQQWYRTTPDRLILDGDGVIELARSPYLANVKHLNLAMNRIDNEGLRAIANAAWRLETLELGHNALHDGAVTALVGPATAGLVSLGLDGNGVDAGELARMKLPNLRELDLESNALGPDGIATFCNAFALPSLRRIRLERNGLNDAGAHTIASCAAFANLTELEAGHNRFGAKGGTAIANSPHLAKLERLTLNEPRWKPEMRDVFAASQTLARTKIYLAGKLVSRKTPAKRVARARAKK